MAEVSTLKRIRGIIKRGIKRIWQRILYGLRGGEYGERQEERIKKTPEGGKMLKSLKTKGFLETYKELKRK